MTLMYEPGERGGNSAFYTVLCLLFFLLGGGAVMPCLIFLKSFSLLKRFNS